MSEQSSKRRTSLHPSARKGSNTYINRPSNLPYGDHEETPIDGPISSVSRTSSTEEADRKWSRDVLLRSKSSNAASTKPATQTRSQPDMSKQIFFYGKPGQLEPVITYVTVDFLARGITDEPTKCGTLASLFRGPALSWLTSQLSLKTELLTKYERFVALLRKEFGINDHAKKHQATKALRNLTQRGSAQLYCIQLEAAAQQIGLDDATQQAYFIEGLKLHVREALVTTRDNDWTYAQLKQEAIRIDTELYNARRRGAGRTGQGQGKQSGSGQIKCHKCGKFGHKKSQCRSGGSSDEF